MEEGMAYIKSQGACQFGPEWFLKVCKQKTLVND
jgi:hypothetical protein